MAKSFDGSEDYVNGPVVVSDSKDVPNVVTNITQGLNGSIAFIFKSYERHLIVEFRSQTALDSFRTSIVNNNGEITYDSKTYLVKYISFTEHFDSVPPVWTLAIILYRDG